jgi:hypothetical protein
MSEWIVPTGAHATDHRAVPNSKYGSDKIPGTAVGDSTIFFQSGKKSLVEYYPNEYDNFRANNMALMAPQMLSESPAREFDFTVSPYTKLLITREDGTIAVLLYERGTGTFAWSRLTTSGKIKSAGVLPGPDGNDDIFLVTERAGNHYLEKLTEEGSVYLDSWQKVTDWDAQKTEYTAGKYKAVRIFINEKGEYCYETCGIIDQSKTGEWHIGYPYKSAMRTMPIITNKEMKKQRIVALIFRFLKSYLPKMTSITRSREPRTDVITAVQPPYTGVCRQPFPGSFDEEVQAELSTDEAAPVTILALNAETQGAA